MRLTYAYLSLAILGVAARAAATSCLEEEAPWQDGGASPLGRGEPDEDPPDLRVPLDARPWEMVSCSSLEPAITGRCELVDGDLRLAVAVEQDGAGFCERAYTERVDYTHPYYIRRFVPAMPLTPGRRYAIECQDPVEYPGVFEVRADDTPAAPAPPIVLASARFVRTDDGGCCGDGPDLLELRLDDMQPAYLAEGGYIEAVYPNGQRLALVRAQDDHFELPFTREVIELTPVSAAGVRGETLVYDTADADGDPVYIPCAISPRRPDAALWLLAPLGWIFAQRRRARRPA